MAAADFISSEEKDLVVLNMPEEQCPKCGVAGNITGKVTLNYVSFIGIPIFPIGRARTAVCRNCRSFFGWTNMPHEMKEKLHTESKKVPHKYGYYFGLALIIVALLVVIIINKTS